MLIFHVISNIHVKHVHAKHDKQFQVSMGMKPMHSSESLGRRCSVYRNDILLADSRYLVCYTLVPLHRNNTLG